MGERMTDYSLDQIGKRLRGENLTDEEKILAADDKVRVEWVRDQLKHADYIYDIGASDGSVTATLDATVFLLESHPAHRDALARSGRWCFLGDAEDGLKQLPIIDGGLEKAYCGEVLEHLSPEKGAAILHAIPMHCQWLIVTVPHCPVVGDIYGPQGRSRWDWPDHVRRFWPDSLDKWLRSCGWEPYSLTHDSTVDPIVGTIEDSIWLGAVCRRA
jgi:hypothetical protein